MAEPGFEKDAGLQPVRSSEEIFERIQRLESGLRTGDMLLGGMHVWPALRQNLVTRLNKLISDQDPTSERLWPRLAAKGSMILRKVMNPGSWSAGAPLPSGPVDVLVVTDAFAKRIRIDGKWVDVFVEPLLAEFERQGKSIHVLETNTAFLDREPSMRPATRIMSRLVRWFLIAQVQAWKVRPSAAMEAEYKSYLRLMAEEGFAEHVMPLRELRAEVSYVNTIMKGMASLLDDLKPELILLMPYTSFVGKALCRLARERGIRIADVQHGVQGSFHVSYGRFSRIPPGGFNVMPSHFLTWSDQDAETIDSWADPEKGPRVLVTGNAFQESFLRGGELARRVDAEVQAAFPGNRTLVLVSLVWSFFIPELFVRVMEDAPDHFFFLVRFHPSTPEAERAEVLRRLAQVERDNFDVEQATDLPIYGILRAVSWNLTTRSTTVKEAADFGVPSLVTDPVGKAYYADLISEGKAVACTDAESVLEALSSEYQFPGDAARPEVDLSGTLNRLLNH